MPSDLIEFLGSWKKVVWAIASEFHFPPDQIWNMYLDDFTFWAEGVGFLIASRTDNVG